MRRLAVLVPIFALGLIAVWLFGLGRETLFGTRSPTAGEESASEPLGGGMVPAELRGLEPEARERRRGEGPAPERLPHPQVADQQPAPHVLRGRVVDDEGRPCHGVHVWQAPKAPGTAPPDAGRQWNNTRNHWGDGRFALAVWRRGDTWIGLRVPGRRTIYLDAAAIAWDDELRVVMPEPIEVRVAVRSVEGTPLPGEVLRATPTLHRGRQEAYAGPDAPLRTLVEQTDEDGVAVFHLERDVPFDVHVIDMLTNPATVRVSGDRSEGVLTRAEPAHLELHVLDGDTGKHLAERIHIQLYDADGRETDIGFRTDASPDVIEVDLPVPPGRYLLEVTARRRRAVLLADLDVTAHGATLRREVRMGPLPARGTLRVEGARAGLSPVDQATHRLGRVTLLIRRLDEGWDALGWTSWHVRVRSDGALEQELLPGRYEVLLLLPGAVGISEHQVELASSATTTVQAQARPGAEVDLYAFLPSDLRVKGVEVRWPGRGRLALVGRAGATHLQGEEEVLRAIHPIGAPERGKAGAGPVLGPYPSGVAVIVTDDEGRRHTFPVR